jgi:hypothetical protein
MDFFYANDNISNPIVLLVKSATDPLLPSPDWSKNLDICDVVNSSKDGPELVCKVLYKRLQENDYHIVLLTLTVIETCMKNCGGPFISKINVQFMDEMISIARCSKGAPAAQEALRLIQQWGIAFENQRNQYPIFFDTYVMLKSKGIIFPSEDATTSASFEVSNTPSSNVNNVREEEIVTNQKEFDKLKQDLQTVLEKVKLCREMLIESPGIGEDEALAEVIGFLEACRDRMTDVIEAGTQGLLDEDLLALSLKTNDAILKTLEAEKTGTRIGVEDDLNISNNNKVNGSGTGNLLDLDESPKAKSNTVSANQMNNDDDDEFSGLTLKTTKIGSGGGIGKKNINKPFTPLVPPPPTVNKCYESNSAHTDQNFYPPIPGPPGHQVKIEESTISPFMNPDSSLHMTEKKPDTSALEFDNFLESLGNTNNNANKTNESSEPKLL